jgi:CDP-diglyceride synthetase
MGKIVKPSTQYATGMLIVLCINILLCFVLWGLFIMMVIGAWQVLDALFWLSKGDKRRRTYLATVVLYLLLLGAGFYLSGYSETFNTIIVPWFALFYLFIVSYGIAFWYWHITREHARSEDPEAKENSGALDDLSNIA